MKLRTRLIMVFAFAVLALFTLTSCGLVAPDTVDANTITYDGKLFNWTEAKNASSYKVTVNETTSTVATPSFAYSAKKAEEVVAITITSLNEKGKESKESASKSFARLATITEIRFDEEGNAEWDSVDGATEYIVKLNGKDQKTTATTLSRDDFEAGKKNTLSVKPSSANGFADWSAQYSKTYLAAPTDISYDGTSISWKGSTATTGGYEVFINGVSQGVVTGTSMVYDSQGNDLDIVLVAKGDDKNTFTSKDSPAVSYVYLDTVSDLKIEEGFLTWSPIPSATGYELKIDNTVKVVTETKIALQPGTSHSYQVKPVVADGAHYFSSYCAELIGRVLKAPNLLWNDEYSLDDGDPRSNLYWGNDTNEKSGYVIRIDLKVEGKNENLVNQVLGDSANSFDYNFPVVGEYTVRLQTKAANNGTDYDSPFSEPITVVRLAAPALKDITSTPSSYSRGFTIHLDTQTSSGAEGYKLTREGVEDSTVRYEQDQIVVANIVDTNEFDTHDLTYEVQSIGHGLKTIDGKKVVVLNSLKKENLGVTITVLGTPKDITFSGFKAEWTPVNRATGYSISIDQEPLLQASYSFENLASGQTTFKVVARGDGHALIASKESQEYTLIRLYTPTDIQVSTDGEENQLTWHEVTHATSYEIYFNGMKEPVSTKSSLSVNQYLTTTGLTIDLVAVANYVDADNNSTYYVTSPRMQNPVQMIRLSQPTFGDVKVMNGALVWNAPADVNLGQYTPSYRVYDANNNIAFDGEFHSTEFKLKGHCQPGALQFYIVAIGNGTKFINSEPSATISMNYLETPQVERVGTQFTWDSIDSAQQYTIRIDGKALQPIKSELGKISYAWDTDLQYFQAVKTYTIEVTANGDGKTSCDSEPFTISQKVLKENAPAFTLSFTDENGTPATSYSQNGKLQVTINQAAQHSTGYTINYGGTNSKVNDVEQLVDSYAPHAPGEYTVFIKAKGGLFGEDGTLYIASDASTSKKISLLSKVGNVTFNASTISWSASTPATAVDHYDVYIELTDGTFLDVLTTTSASISYSKIGHGFTEIKSVTIQAMANSGNINSEEFTKVR